VTFAPPMSRARQWQTECMVKETEHCFVEYVSSLSLYQDESKLFMCDAESKQHIRYI